MKSLDKLLAGHIKVGRLTIYGRNAMHWGVTFWTKKYGYICFRLPLRCFGKWWKLYWYCSPNATPWAATFMLGHGKDDDWTLARIRYKCFGHNFEVHGWSKEYEMENYAILMAINNSVGCRQWTYANYAKETGLDKNI